MPRGLSTEIKAAIAAGTVHPVYLAFFDFDGGSIRTWTGDGDLSYDSEAWSSHGIVNQWPLVTESIDLVANNITLELSGNFGYAVDIADPAKYRARACEIYIGFLDSSGALPAANVYKIFSGRMAVVGFVEDGEADGYSITVESRLVDLQKAKTVRYTHQSQLQRFPGDRGLEYAGAAQSALFLSRGETPDQPFSRKIVYGTTPVDGAPVFISTSGSGSRYLNLVVAFADHECDAIEQLWLDDRAVLSGGSVAGEFVGVVDYYPHLGTDSQTVDTALQAEVTSTVWTNDHRLRGITYVYLRILYSEELFGTDAPAVAARIRGKKLYDPRTTTTAFSENAALAVRDYLLSENYGFSGGSAEVDDASVSVAANDCDYLVAKADASTERRYTVNGVLDTALPIGENLKRLLDAMAGKLSYLGGVFSVYAGNYSLTSLSVSDGVLVDGLSFRNRNLRQTYNGARGLYRTPALDWQEEDYPVYQNVAALAADGETRWLDLPLPMTTSASRCQRIAKINVMRSRAARMVSLSAMLSMLEIRAGDVISLTTAKSQIGSVVYEVRSLSIVLGLDPRLELELLEVASTDYAWDESTEESELTVPEEPADSILAWTLARLASPSATPGSQTFNTGFNVTVSHNETGVTCRYTTDGSEPTESDSSVADGGTVVIGTSTTTLKLKSFQNSGSLTSEVITYEYTYNAPTDLSTKPAERWAASGGQPEVHWYIGGSLNNLTLKASNNGGSNYTTLTTDGDVGETFDSNHSVPESWAPSDYRAFTQKAGYLDSIVAQMSDRAIPAMGYIEDDNTASPTTNYLRLTAWATNGKLWYRWRRRYYSSGSYGNWNSWSSWSVEDSSVSWGETYNYVMSYNNTFGSRYEYQREFYVEQSGFQNSYITFANGDVFFHFNEYVEIQYP